MSAPKKRPKVLVVEDNPVITTAMASLLRNEGYESVNFHQASPALEYVREQSPDAALVDIHLPDRSGLEICDELRRTCGQDLPIIVVSGDSSMEMLKTLSGKGATHFFSKPVNAATLMGRLRECLAKAS